MADTPTQAPADVADEAGADNFDSSAIIEKFASQLIPTGEAPAPEAAAPAEAAPPAEEAPVQEEVKAEDPPPAEEPTPEQSLSAKRLAALARKEAQLAAKEAELEKRVQEAAARERETLAKKFVQNPIKFVRDAGIPRERLGHVATLLMGEELGEEASPEVQAQLRQLEYEARLAALEESREKPKEEGEKELTPEFRAQVIVTDREIKSIVKDTPSDMPFLAEEAQADPEGTLEALYMIAAPLIRSGTWPSARDVARALNDQLRSDYERLARAAQRAKQSASSTQPPPNAKKETPTALSDADVSPRRSTQPEPAYDDAEAFIQRALRRAQEMGGLMQNR